MIKESDYESHSLYVGDVDNKTSICKGTRRDNSKSIIDLSCSAANNGIYVVVNVLERVNKTNNDNKSDRIYYNTNVVFNRNGAIVAKYRKINLFEEPGITPGTNLTTFETDFGVKFGMFVCFDVLFKRPALDVLLNDENVTDVIFSTYWLSEVPFLNGLSIHSGYARANGINMLSSAVSNSSSGSSGSGIFSHDGTILKKTINYVSSSELLIEEVPKIIKRTPPTAEYPVSFNNLIRLKLSIDGT